MVVIVPRPEMQSDQGQALACQCDVETTFDMFQLPTVNRSWVEVVDFVQNLCEVACIA